jgi:myosin-1
MSAIISLFLLLQMVPQLLVLSTNALLVLDQRTLVIKYRIPTTEVDSMSLSPYRDKLVVFHLKKVGAESIKISVLYIYFRNSA